MFGRPAYVLGSVLLGALGFGALGLGCTPSSRMCVAAADCVSGSACVAGRCQPEKANVKPAIDAARRLVIRPVDAAYLRKGQGPTNGALPPSFALGREGGTLLLRFEAPLPKTANVVEAYVVLRRAATAEDDPESAFLHATRIIDAWDGRSTSWAFAPRTEETRAPVTRVDPAGPSLVRLDVRDIVNRWRNRDPSDQGIAVVAQGASRTGTTFAFNRIGDGMQERQASGLQSGQFPQSVQGGDVEPYLELYLR
ncbi:DNRLRE domain-containing protein [Labilithrix luteola]|nr:DNRLRE domain-containing protein [Labilithrix luteola]